MWVSFLVCCEGVGDWVGGAGFFWCVGLGVWGGVIVGGGLSGAWLGEVIALTADDVGLL